jgi:hypothetical protein
MSHGHHAHHVGHLIKTVTKEGGVKGALKAAAIAVVAIPFIIPAASAGVAALVVGGAAAIGAAKKDGSH